MSWGLNQRWTGCAIAVRRKKIKRVTLSRLVTVTGTDSRGSHATPSAIHTLQLRAKRRRRLLIGCGCRVYVCDSDVFESILARILLARS